MPTPHTLRCLDQCLVCPSYLYVLIVLLIPFSRNGRPRRPFRPFRRQAQRNSSVIPKTSNLYNVAKLAVLYELLLLLRRLWLSLLVYVRISGEFRLDEAKDGQPGDNKATITYRNGFALEAPSRSRRELHRLRLFQWFLRDIGDSNGKLAKCKCINNCVYRMWRKKLWSFPTWVKLQNIAVHRTQFHLQDDCEKSMSTFTKCSSCAFVAVSYLFLIYDLYLLTSFILLTGQNILGHQSVPPEARPNSQKIHEKKMANWEKNCTEKTKLCILFMYTTTRRIVTFVSTVFAHSPAILESRWATSDADDFYYNLWRWLLHITLSLKPTIREMSSWLSCVKLGHSSSVSIPLIPLLGHGDQFVPPLSDSGMVMLDTNRRE